MKKQAGKWIFSPSDLICYLKSPFASWMDRYDQENPNCIKLDDASEADQLIAKTGDLHEQAILKEYQQDEPELVEISRNDAQAARAATRLAIQSKAPIIYQAAFADGSFAGYADFLELNPNGQYQVWDTKLARSPKPYYAIQLCCYSELLAATTGKQLPEKFGIILGNQKRVEFRVADFFHYYLRIKANFLRLQKGFTGIIADRPEPLPRADHGRWNSYAQEFFAESDHLVQVAGITVGQIKKLKKSGITTMADLASVKGGFIPKLAEGTLEKLSSQARLQCQTRTDRESKPDSPPRYELLPHQGPNGEGLGLATLPKAHPADVFFDMEGYPLISGGLEYLFGVSYRSKPDGPLEFIDWWAHDRQQEKAALEGFVDWVHSRWSQNPGLHIYHYAAYEVSAVRRLSTRHDTRQEEVDQLLRNNVFIDLYKVVRSGLRIGGENYSIKTVEQLYRPSRVTSVATAADSIVQYAHWIESGQSQGWQTSEILKNIRDYNEDDCKSTAELLAWLTSVATGRGISFGGLIQAPEVISKEMSSEQIRRAKIADELRLKGDPTSIVLADLIDFHRREEKPMWWKMFDRADATPEELRDDAGCIAGIKAEGQSRTEKKSLAQRYRFDASQECKLNEDRQVMFTHNLAMKLNLLSLDTQEGILELKATSNVLNQKSGGAFPLTGSIMADEYVSSTVIHTALADVISKQCTNQLHSPVSALMNRVAPSKSIQIASESGIEAAIRITSEMSGGCLTVQGPPGAGKTYTASCTIASLLLGGKRIGIAANSHKVILNLLAACGDALAVKGIPLKGIKVGGGNESSIFLEHPQFQYLDSSTGARDAYTGGIVGGTAWLFVRPEWEGALDYLFIDEAGQVSLANAVAMARCANNLILLGDQMQLEQPIQGSHPGDAGLSALQYSLKDTTNSELDAPAFHAVMPSDYGLFLGESHRMHPEVCRFISESIYEGRLASHLDCANQKIEVSKRKDALITQESGVLFSGLEHDGNVQQSDEEVERVVAIFQEMLGCRYTDKKGVTRPLELKDFLFVAPYNAQVRAFRDALPPSARVGSVDRFQGQEAPVCILSLCSSFGEYGSRGLAFILDLNRINVAISRAQCLAIVVADPRIASAEASSLDEMRLINLFCKIASDQA